MPRRLGWTPCVAMIAVSVLVAIATGTVEAPRANAAPQRSARYAGPGPFAAGVTTLEVGGTPVEVWYPADARSVRGHERDKYFFLDWTPPSIRALVPPDLNPAFRTDAYRDVKASSKGPFPLVTFAHGFGGFRDQSTFLTTHLASWGFVVVAPDLPESTLAVTLGQPAAPPGTDVDTLRAAADAVRAAARSTGVLAGIVRRGKIAAIGHSMGARASIQFAADSQVATYIALDGTTRSLPTNYAGQVDSDIPSKPSMYIGAASEWLLPDYDAVPGPKRLVLETQSTHVTGFTDICRIGEDQGGLVEVARRAGLTAVVGLLEAFLKDCVVAPDLLPSAPLQPVTAHYVTAELRYTLGIDAHPIGLGKHSARGFGSVGVEIYSGAYTGQVRRAQATSPLLP